VQGDAKERWLQLCEQAAVEQDRDKLLQLMREISRLLEEKENRLSELRRAKHS
jgi:small-conductance mechanosensitive channel